MKKLLIALVAVTLSLSAAPAFAKSKKSRKHVAQSWQCTVGTETITTASVEECMKKGGMVQNYPGPSKAMPAKKMKTKKVKKGKKK